MHTRLIALLLILVSPQTILNIHGCSTDSMNKAIFLDRDGVLNTDKGYTYRVEELQLIPELHSYLRLQQSLGYLLIVITNQSGIGRGYYSISQMQQFHRALSLSLQDRDIIITDFYYCLITSEAKWPYNFVCNCRKPAPGLILKAMSDYNIDPARSVMVGILFQIRRHLAQLDCQTLYTLVISPNQIIL